MKECSNIKTKQFKDLFMCAFVCAEILSIRRKTLHNQSTFNQYSQVPMRQKYEHLA